jgi:peroxiredoxin
MKMKKITYTFFVLAILMVGFDLSAQEKSSPVLLGDKFPEIKLLSNEGKQVSLSDFKGKKIILIFPRGKVADNHWCNLCHYQYAELAKLDVDQKIKDKYKIEILFVLPYPKDTIDKWQNIMPESLKMVEKWKNPEDPNNENKKNWAEIIKRACPETFSYKNDKYPFPFPILIDGDHAFSSKLGLYREEWDGGKTGQNVPTIFILDEQSIVKFKFMAQNTLDRPNANYLVEFVKKMM